MRTFQSLLLALALLPPAPPAIAEMKVISEGKAIQIQTDEFVVHSESIGRNFLIEVSRPDGLQPNQKTAAIYATDGGFGIIGPASRMLMADGKIPKVHVISIGYPDDKGRHRGPRNTDLVHGQPTFEGRTWNGGGAAFEAFILNDVRPFIEARYPVDPARSVLFGHSAGGLFVANVLVNRPDAFAGYLIGGLPISGDPTLIEKAKAVAPRGNGRRVFIGYCPNDVKRLRADEFTAPLSGPNSTFKVLEQNFTDENHNSEILMLVAKGFRFLLPTDGSDRVAITLKPEILERYVGVYRVNANRTVTISREGARLFASNGGERVEIFAESDTNFFARDAYAQLSFKVGSTGTVEGVLTRLNDVEATATRVN